MYIQKSLRHIGLPAIKALAVTDIRLLCAEESLDDIIEVCNIATGND